MKKHPHITFSLLTWLVFFPLSSTFAQKQGASSVREIPEYIDLKLQRDAARLALREVTGNGNPSNQAILIPANKINEIYEVLAILYRKEAKVRAIEKCDIHTFPDPSIDLLVVIFKKNARWAESVKKGAQKTGDAHLDGLLTKYKLGIEKLVRWDDAHDALILRAEQPLNMAALAITFLKIENVAKVETGAPETTGNDIEAKAVEGGWEVTYVLRFGAHINGKGKMHTWKFRVADNGSVKFLGESGDKIPSWMDCSEVGKN